MKEKRNFVNQHLLSGSVARIGFGVSLGTPEPYSLTAATLKKYSVPGTRLATLKLVFFTSAVTVAQVFLSASRFCKM